MKKLNDRGWGFVMFIFFLGVLGIALLMVVYMVNEFETGLSPNRSKDVTYSQYQRYKRYEREVVSVASNYSKVNGVSNYINISELDIDNDIRNECVGYAMYDKTKTSYTAYLKCGSYQTDGYAK